MNKGDMGLDQTLYWIGDPSESQVRRLRHRNLSNTNCSTGLSYISEEDYHDERYKYIRSFEYKGMNDRGKHGIQNNRYINVAFAK